VYLIVIFIILICVSVWVVLFLNKPNQTERTGREARKGDKQFVFSSDKPFVASRKPAKTKLVEPEKPKPEIIKNETPAAIPPKMVQPETQKQEPPIKKAPPKTEVTVTDSSKKPKPPSDPGDLDFDHLSELIDDFFSEEKNPNNS
jgi:hypothetical protein